MLDNDKLTLFENPNVEQTENVQQMSVLLNKSHPVSHMEIHVQKKLIKENNINLVTERLRIYRQHDKS